MGVSQRRHQGRKQSKKGLLASCHLTFISCQFEEKRKSLFENKHFELSSICLFAPKRPKLKLIDVK